MALLCGASLVIADRAALLPGDTLNETLSARGVTHVTLPPVAAGLLPENGKPTQLAALIVAGEACPASLVEQWAGRIHMFNAYGPTEGTVCATVHACSAGSGGLTPIGRPIQNVRVYILDGSGQPAPVGVPGEIYIGGAGVARGYHNLPELTDARFLDDPFTARGEKMYRSGDVGRWLADGNIEYLGRNDAQVKLRGFRIEPGEVDAALLRCDGVLEARTCVREDAPGDRRLVSYVLAEGGAEPRPAALRSALAGRLPEYMLPEAFVTLAAFPVTPNGKLDYAALPAPELGARVSRAYEAPLGRQEVLLAGLWAELLGVPRVGRQDNFFELGGHSIKAVVLLSKLRTNNYDVGLRDLLINPTLRKQAGVIRGDNDPLLCCELKNPVEIKEGAGDTPLFMVHESTGEPMVYSRLSSLLNDSIPVYILHALDLSSSDSRPSTLSELAEIHFERIKSVQPSGPYRMLGWSLGGLLSLEIAKKIIDGGDCISFLGMVDTYYSYDNIEVVREVIHSKVPGKQIEHKRALVPNGTPLVMDIVDKAISSGFIEEDKRNEYLNNICYLTSLANGYTSDPIAVDLVLYAASLENADKIDRGWGSVIKGRLTVMEMSADHFSIMGGVNVEKVASSINKFLAK
ncbi:MAG: Linear gramicidin synthase subunit D [Candidatus Erwinia impunctatus]|nr:Linear gramicidin synthase subunit D [Culicoides impunctatus]